MKQRSYLETFLFGSAVNLTNRPAFLECDAALGNTQWKGLQKIEGKKQRAEAEIFKETTHQELFAEDEESKLRLSCTNCGEKCLRS
ncbi:MAG: hypothetical protein OXH50_06800 [Gemmatimonadetes bacterium]|nr:hypothetical protein [Gemmatimonadota bacterium]